MFEFSKIYIRSIAGITATSIVMVYLGVTDPIVIGGYFTTVVACVLLDKPEVI